MVRWLFYLVSALDIVVEVMVAVSRGRVCLWYVGVSKACSHAHADV